MIELYSFMILVTALFVGLCLYDKHYGVQKRTAKYLAKIEQRKEQAKVTKVVF